METVSTETGEVRQQANQSQSIAKLAEALAKAQGKIRGAMKDAENPFFKSKYADLASVWDACREPLSSAGLAVIQTFENGVGGVTIITTLAHSSGEWIRGSLAMKPAKDDPQSVGSAITYGRRYALAAMVGVAPEDDDGNAASHREIKPGGTFAPAPRPADWKVDAETLKNAIDGTRTAPELDALIKANSATLATVKEHSPTAYDFLMDRSTKHRGLLAQAPPGLRPRTEGDGR